VNPAANAFMQNGNSFGGAANLGTNDFNALNFRTDTTTRMTITNTGAVGIGSVTPMTRLDVAGTLRVANGGEACTLAVNGGMIRYTGGNLQFCNGSAWQTLGVSGAGLQSLNGSTNTAQTFATGATGTFSVTLSDGTIAAFRAQVKSFTISNTANDAARGSVSLRIASEPAWFV
jgi:hypothetical protein